MPVPLGLIHSTPEDGTSSPGATSIGAGGRSGPAIMPPPPPPLRLRRRERRRRRPPPPGPCPGYCESFEYATLPFGWLPLPSSGVAPPAAPARRRRRRRLRG